MSGLEKYERDLSSCYDRTASPSTTDSRTRLVRRTYLNLTFAVLASAALETLIFSLFGIAPIARFVSDNYIAIAIFVTFFSFCLLVVGNCMGSRPSRFGQYCLLGFYVVMYALTFVPILTVAAIFVGSTALIWEAIGLTAALFVALLATVFMTRKDFSFPGLTLRFVSIAALILIVGALIFDFDLGARLSAAIIALICVYLLSDMSPLLLVDEGDDVMKAIEFFIVLETLPFIILGLLKALLGYVLKTLLGYILRLLTSVRRD